MAAYEDDLNRFLDSLDDLAIHREAANTERGEAYQRIVDKAMRSLAKTNRLGGIFDTDEAMRGFVIERLKAMGKIPVDFR